MTQFLQGYVVFTHIFLLSIVIGIIAFFVRAFKEVNAENRAKREAKNQAIITSLLRKCGDFDVTYNEKYDTYYVFNIETGAFVMQNQNPVTVLEYMRDHYISYNLRPANEDTARIMVSSVKALLAAETQANLEQYGVQEV